MVMDLSDIPQVSLQTYWKCYPFIPLPLQDDPEDYGEVKDEESESEEEGEEPARDNALTTSVSNLTRPVEMRFYPVKH